LACGLIHVLIDRHSVVIIFMILHVCGMSKPEASDALTRPDEQLVSCEVPTGREDLASHFIVFTGWPVPKRMPVIVVVVV
jgi:hypothetical protein